MATNLATYAAGSSGGKYLKETSAYLNRENAGFPVAPSVEQYDQVLNITGAGILDAFAFSHTINTPVSIRIIKDGVQFDLLTGDTSTGITSIYQVIGFGSGINQTALGNYGPLIFKTSLVIQMKAGSTGSYVAYPRYRLGTWETL